VLTPLLDPAIPSEDGERQRKQDDDGDNDDEDDPRRAHAI
jgi:hypothetical protein